MTTGDIVTAVIFANAVTVGFLYACWRLNKNGPDLLAVGIGLTCLLFGGIMALPGA